jgi:ATP-dependent DNA helicase DinG
MFMDTPLAFPALHASHAGIWVGSIDGQVTTVGKGEAAGRAAETPMVMLNAPLVAQRLGYPDLSGLDLLELFAFVYPARFAVPTPKGMAKALGITPPTTDQEVPQFLLVAARTSLGTQRKR